MHYNPRLYYSNSKIHEFIIPTFFSRLELFDAYDVIIKTSIKGNSNKNNTCSASKW